MTTDERIDKLASAVQDLERVMRQGFAVLTELHADTQRGIAETQREIAETQREIAGTNQAMQKLANAMSALADHVADHETRLDKLEGQ